MSKHLTKWTAIKDGDIIKAYTVTDRKTGDMLAIVNPRSEGGDFSLARLFGAAEAYNGVGAFSRMADLQKALEPYATSKDADNAAQTTHDAVSFALAKMGMDADAGIALSTEDEITDMLSETDSDVSDVPTVENDEQ